MTRILQTSIIAALALLLLLRATVSTAQSPRRLKEIVSLSRPAETSGSAGGAIFTSSAQIVAAFNKGRRAEETQFGFPANSLGIFSLPADYESFTAPQRAVFIINAERKARAGLDYGDGPVPGKPLEGAEVNLNKTAQDHAAYMDATGIFSNLGPDGSTPYSRIHGTYNAGCLQDLGVQVANAFIFGNYRVEAAIFEWLYRDSSEDGLTRLTILIQNSGRSGNGLPLIGYIDDHGASGSEGFLGIGISGSYIVLNVADPSNSAGCPFSITEDPLPVHLISWQGEYKNGAVKLTWETAWEENADYFQIQRSIDLKNFIPIAKVASKGTTHEQQNYESTDFDPAPGINYYRLIQTDLNGSTEISRIIAVRNELISSEKLQVYPNPAKPDAGFRIKVQGNAARSIHLFNVTGLELPVVTSAESDGEMLIKSAETLPAGIYSLVVSENGQKWFSRVLVR